MDPGSYRRTNSCAGRVTEIPLANTKFAGASPMRNWILLWIVLTSLLLTNVLVASAAQAESFRVFPYLQNPTQEAITVRWLSDSEDPGILTVETPDGRRTLPSQPVRARALAYNPFHPEPGGPHSGLPWLHSIRVKGLRPGTKYDYQVRQGAQQ